MSLFDETVVIGSGGGPAGETEAKLFGPSCGTFWGDQTTACDGSGPIRFVSLFNFFHIFESLGGIALQLGGAECVVCCQAH